MRLQEIVKRILCEQDQDNIIEFPNENMTVSVFRAEKKLIFSPQEHESLPSKIRTVLHLLKQNFHVLRVKHMAGNSFELDFDPREDFESVITFIKQHSGQAESIY